MSDKKTEREESLPGLDREITRRDFVGNTLVGAGAGLLAMHAPGTRAGNNPAVKNRSIPQQMPVPLTGLTADWTGPGGVGDYAGKNGNTHEVVNAAHAIRNREFDKQLGGARDTGETFDLVVVGCGFAGITAAATYLEGNPDARILLLDNHAIFGGEAKENEFEVDGYRLWGPQGSTGTVFSKDKTRLPLSVHRMWQKLGLPESFEHQELEGTDKDILVPVDVWGAMHARWEDADLGWYFREHGWIKDPWSNGMRNAPISDNLKNDYYAMELFRRPPRRADWKQWLDSMTYKEFVMNVMGLSDEVFPYLDPLLAAMGTGLGCDVISAYQAYEFVAPGVHAYRRYQGLGDPTNFSYIASFPGGNGALLKYFVRFLIPDAISGDNSLANMAVYGRVNWEALDRRNAPVKMRLSSTVAAVQHNGAPDTADDVSVTYYKDGELHRVNARHVAVCSGQWVNRYIVRDLPDEHFEAMGEFHHAPILTLNVAVRNWKFMENLGISAARWFEGFGWFMSLRRQMLFDGKAPMPLDPAKPTVLTLFIPFTLHGMPLKEQAVASRMQMFGMSYREIETRIREQFSEMFSAHGFDAKRDIAGIIANRHGHAYGVSGPGFYFGNQGREAPSDVIRRGFGRVRFGHSELTGHQLWTTAAEEGERAALQLLDIA